MAGLPIKRITLYKHGVGSFERRAETTSDVVELSFHVNEMNDILKSLTVVDWGEGQVLGVDYATPQSREERLAGCSVRLSDNRSLQDLLVGQRGRRLSLLLDQGEDITGRLVGIDTVSDRQPVGSCLVSLLGDASATVQVVPLSRIQGVELLDERGAADLRFFLQTALSHEEYRTLTIRLSHGTHDLSVSYISPAPTWRVSYRLLTEPDATSASNTPGTALLQGWGVFDNQLEEDLEGISLSLVAGMPISFIYDLYTPFTPERPIIQEAGRTAAAPVSFDAAYGPLPAAEPELGRALKPGPVAKSASMAGGPSPQDRRRVNVRALEQATAVEAAGADLGELFEYRISTPVTVARGHSAMVPILQARLSCERDLIYNARKLPTHPVATARLKNDTGLILEKGPVTVLEAGDYVGEALLPFTVVSAEVMVPYAVELGVKVHETNGTKREFRGLDLKGAYLQFEEWEIRWREYDLDNATGEAKTVLLEHPRTHRFDLFDTPEPIERTSEYLRFEVTVPPRAQTVHRVSERLLRRRREEIQSQTYAGLKSYLSNGLLKPQELTQLSRLLELWEGVAALEDRVAHISRDRDRIYKAQQQVQGNMGTLGRTGKEGALRTRYVEQLEDTERQLGALGKEEAEANAEIRRLRQEIDDHLASLS